MRAVVGLGRSFERILDIFGCQFAQVAAPLQVRLQSKVYMRGVHLGDVLYILRRLPSPTLGSALLRYRKPWHARPENSHLRKGTGEVSWIKRLHGAVHSNLKSVVVGAQNVFRPYSERNDGSQRPDTC